VLIRFAGVIIIDGSVIGLPADLTVQFPGGANQTGHQAAPKIGVGLDLLSGRLDGPYPIAARPHDRLLPIQDAPVAPGVLRLAGRPPGSIGFFDLTVLAALSAQRAYWLTRVQHGTVILDGTGRRRDLVALLRRNCIARASHARSTDAARPASAPPLPPDRRAGAQGGGGRAAARPGRQCAR
jgi:hypothetical protein